MIDLSSDLSLTFRLLNDSTAWKHRLVEQIAVGSAEYFTVRRSYQIELTAEILEGVGVPADTDTIRALVPLATLPKAPLLSFDLVAPDGGTTALELRRSGAAVQAGYLASLAIGDGLSQRVLDDAFPEGLLEAICAFTPDPYLRFLEAAGGRVELALRWYLADGLGFDVAIADVINARAVAGWSARHLVAALGEPPDPTSSSENVLLAAPLLGSARPRNGAELIDLVRAFHGGVAVATALEATSFLGTLAEYGRRWEALTEIDLRHGSPTIVKSS